MVGRHHVAAAPALRAPVLPARGLAVSELGFPALRGDVGVYAGSPRAGLLRGAQRHVRRPVVPEFCNFGRFGRFSQARPTLSGFSLHQLPRPPQSREAYAERAQMPSNLFICVLIGVLRKY